MKTKHTPGPWRVYCGSQVVHTKRAIIETEKDFKRVCTITVVYTPEWQANAKLIATAPKMLKVLYDINCICAEAANKEDGKVDYDRIAKLSMRAIKEATE